MTSKAGKLGLGLGLAALLGVGVTTYERGRDMKVPVPPPKPIIYVLPSRDSIEDGLRSEMAKLGHVVQTGETYSSIGEKLYGSKEAGKRLKSMNEFMGRTSMAMVAVVTDPFIDVDGNGKRTYWDWVRRPQVVRAINYPFLGVGDTLFTPQYMSGFDGMSYEYSVPVPDADVENVYDGIKTRVIDSFGGVRGKVIYFKRDEPSGRRFDERAGGDLVGSAPGSFNNHSFVYY
ncbi:hypothetical protein HYT23_04525 [Candidatus Pacearchaeota archaeon]|nr:hypothetical protein [Candidatus Pacearchaeota archaeon]